MSGGGVYFLGPQYVQPTTESGSATWPVEDASVGEHLKQTNELLLHVLLQLRQIERVNANITRQAITKVITAVDATAAVPYLTFLPDDQNRRGFAIYNNSSATLYLAYQGQASSAFYMVPIGARPYYEDPFRFTCQVVGIWSSANGNALVTALW